MRWRRRGGTEERCQNLPPTARSSKKDGTVLVDSGLGPKIAARILGKTVSLLLGFRQVGLVPVSSIKLSERKVGTEVRRERTRARDHRTRDR